MAPMKRKASSRPAYHIAPEAGPSATRTPTFVPSTQFAVKPEEDADYQFLITRRVLPSRYMCKEAVTKLGFKDEVERHLKFLGLEYLCTRVTKTYPRLVYEFLTTLKAEGDRFHIPFQKISFRLLDKEFCMSLERFCTLLKCNFGGYTDYPSSFNSDLFWSEITSDTMHKARNARASSIHNPIFRVLHRLLSTGPFAKNETQGVVGKTDLFFLWCVVQHERISSGYYIMCKLLETKKQKKREAGDIMCGGVISLLAMQLGLQIGDLEPAPGKNLVDITYLISCGLISRHGNSESRFKVHITKTQFVIIPDASRNDIRDKATWKVQLQPENEEGTPVGGASSSTPAPTPAAPTPQPPSTGTQTEYGWTMPDVQHLFTYVERRFDHLDTRLDQMGVINESRFDHLSTQYSTMYDMVNCMDAWLISQGHYPVPQSFQSPSRQETTAPDAPQHPFTEEQQHQHDQQEIHDIVNQFLPDLGGGGPFF